MSRATRVKVGLSALAVLGLVLGSRFVDLAGRTRQFLEWVDQLGFWAPLGYLLIAVVDSMVFGPAWLVITAAGVMFGFGWGLLWAWTGSVLGGMCAFVAGRYLLRGWVERKIAGNKRLMAIDRAVGKGGWKIAFLVRLLPVIPLSMIHYTLSVTRISPLIYFTTLAVGMVPGIVVNVFIGWFLGDLARLEKDLTERPAWQWALSLLGIFGALLFAYWIYRTTSRIIREQSPDLLEVEP